MISQALCLLLALPTLAQEDEPQEALPIPRDVLDRAIEDYLERNPPPTLETPWSRTFQKLALYGDVRLRHESNFQEDAEDRHRQRIRARLGANYELYDSVIVGTRLVTGNRDDAKSHHITFGDGFDSLEISLDRAFVSYRPTSAPSLDVRAGKFAHGFWQNPVYGELVWDADIQPEGVSVEYAWHGGDTLRALTLRGGGYVYLEKGAGDDAHAAVLQADVDLDLGSGWSGHFATSYLWFSDLTPDGADDLFEDNAGNDVVDNDGDGEPDDYLSRFGILNPILSVSLPVGDQTAQASAEYIRNTEAHGDDDQGYAIGFSVGRAKQKGDWRAYYQWQHIEQEAILSAVAQDDFLLTTNHQSHVLGVNYQFADQVGLHLWGLISKPEDAKDGQNDDTDWRLRLDLNIRF